MIETHAGNFADVGLHGQLTIPEETDIMYRGHRCDDAVFNMQGYIVHATVFIRSNGVLKAKR